LRELRKKFTSGASIYVGKRAVYCCFAKTGALIKQANQGILSEVATKPPWAFKVHEAKSAEHKLGSFIVGCCRIRQFARDKNTILSACNTLAANPCGNVSYIKCKLHER